MRNFITFKFAILSAFFIFISCNEDSDSVCDDDISPGASFEERARYGEYVTPEIEYVLMNQLFIKIKRGENPPNVIGFFRVYNNCASANFDDESIGTVLNIGKLKFYNKEGMNVSLEAKTYREDESVPAEFKTIKNTFISGSGDDFSIYFYTENKYPDGKNHYKSLNIISGTLSKSKTRNIDGNNKL